MLEQDREIFDVAEHTEQVMFQATTRKTENDYDLPMIVHERLAFSPEEYVRRYDNIQREMAAQGLDALLVRGPENITYFSGYETPGYYKYHCVVVPRDGEPVFLVRDFDDADALKRSGKHTDSSARVREYQCLTGIDVVRIHDAIAVLFVNPPIVAKPPVTAQRDVAQAIAFLHHVKLTGFGVRRNRGDGRVGGERRRFARRSRRRRHRGRFHGCAAGEHVRIGRLDGFGSDAREWRHRFCRSGFFLFL